MNCKPFFNIWLSFFIDLDAALMFQTIFTSLFMLLYIPYDKELIKQNYAYLGLVIIYIALLVYFLYKIPVYLYKNYIKKFNEYIDNL